MFFTHYVTLYNVYVPLTKLLPDLHLKLIPSFASATVWTPPPWKPNKSVLLSALFVTFSIVIKENSKVNHLSYVGDTYIGKNYNIGAGTITCNYDGLKKNKTKISNNVFIGSNSSLVAPIKIEEGSVVGAGSVITKKVKKGSLALTRASQIEITKYKKRKKK